MGTNKALLTVGGESLLAQKWHLCAAFSERLISVNEITRYKESDLDFLSEEERQTVFVVDETKEFGPLEGIYQLLRHARGTYVLVLAVDMPKLSEEFLEALCEKLADEDCLVLLNYDHKPEPMCSIYGKNCIPVLEEMRCEGLHRPRMLYDQVRTAYVSLQELGFDAEVICNVNTPEEYNKIRG